MTSDDDQERTSQAPAADDETTTRRSFASRAAGVAMVGGLAAGYGAFALHSVRYVYGQPEDSGAWLFVSDVSALESGTALEFEGPSGARAVIARRGSTGDVSDFVALSSVCPHLGCVVHWEAANNRFFCPCHNGVFDPTGKGVSGPPGKAGQSLPRFDLKIENGLLFIRMPPHRLATRDRKRAPCSRAGHDECLANRGPLRVGVRRRRG